ncbi:unnamed protein product [Protopolystoma xenopodis]|uniref:Uncharacterized protein n=1 Tax=Protopolystoma xenopodis TaxID=117903 RepID=A0A448WB43_9PLAT|nr:unnamed protein product [Protopolystoma xenopodis]
MTLSPRLLAVFCKRLGRPGLVYRLVVQFYLPGRMLELGNGVRLLGRSYPLTALFGRWVDRINDLTFSAHRLIPLPIDPE